MKILLLNCQPEATHLKTKPTVPLGLLSISAFLQSKGIPSTLRNLAIGPPSALEIEQMLSAEKADVVGISFYTDNCFRAYELSKNVRKVLPQSTIVMGGHHASYLYGQLLEGGFADIVVIGEGEQTFYELIRALDDETALDDVAGLAFRRNGQTVVTAKREFIRDLDSLPPYYHAISEHDTHSHRLSPKAALAAAGGTLGDRPWEFSFYPLITTRGCPFDCQFCASTVLGGGDKNYWRAESPGRVAGKVQYLYETHNCRFVDFWDNSFNIQPDRVAAICKEFMRRELRVRWKCTMRANLRLNAPGMLKLMAKAGCYKVHYGIESGSQEILDNISKRIAPAEMIETISRAKDADLQVRGLFMVGNPGEREETVRESIGLARASRPENLVVALAIVYPGTGLYALAKQRGLIDDDYWLTCTELPLFPADKFLRSTRWLASVRFADHRMGKLLTGMYVTKTWLRRLTGILVSLKGARMTSRVPPLFDRCGMA